MPHGPNHLLHILVFAIFCVTSSHSPLWPIITQWWSDKSLRKPLEQKDGLAVRWRPMYEGFSPPSWRLRLDSDLRLLSCISQTDRLHTRSIVFCTRGSCWKCKDGWEQHGEKCYFFSTKKSTWNEREDECRQHGGGDLVKIDSTEELRDVMADAEDKFWIGLTDSKEEGTWLWADGSPLNSRMGEKGGAVEHKSWFDKYCEIPHRYICEKPAETGEMKCT
uniref:CD209 antigen-like protein C n=1 Tax=Labrus bergylta TaxID=56723 RepID=A0A3Q3EE66_9LABR